MNKNAQISMPEELAPTIERLNINSLRPTQELHKNALLRRYEWEEIDAAVIRIAKTALNGVQDLIDNGLVRRLGGLGTLTSSQEQLGDMTPANVSMDGETAGEEDSVPYSPLVWPVPIIHKDFRINIRTLEASRRLGDSLDTSSVEVATRRVLEAAEAMLFNGVGLPNVGGYQGQGYTNKTQRISDTAGGFGGGDFGTWGNGYKTIAGMLNRLAGRGYNGPFGVYVSRTQYGQLVGVNEFGVSEIATILQGIPLLRFVKPGDMLADGVVVAVSLNSDVVDLAIAQDLTVVQWESRGGMVDHFKVMWTGTPRVKHDAAENCGVATATGA